MVGVIKQLAQWLGTAAIFAVLLAPSVSAVSVPDAINGGDSKGICQKFADHPADFPNPPAGCSLTGEQTQRQLIGKTNGKVDPSKSYIFDFVNIFVYATATLSVIFLLVGAIRYLTATGNASRIQQAKDTVLYAIIGLIVAILARPIADFVINKVSG